MLFNDTIYQNVLNGLQKNQCDNLSHTKKLELVISACKQANAHDFISKLPGKYETLTGERATALSGGQKQRIAIARSIISNPTILLLDEATSALDSASERTVSDALEKASQDRTTVMITHKLSTAMKANSIVVFDKGSIIEQGTHAELLALNGKYCRMLLAQGAVSNQSSTKNVPVHPNDSVGTVQPNPESTQDKAPTDQSISPLESVEVRRRSLFWCIYRTYMENPTLIWPSLLAAAAAIAAGASFPVQAFIFSRFVTVFQASGAELMRRGDFWALMFFILGISTLISYMVGLFVQGLVSTKLVKIYWPSYLKAMLHQDISFFQHTGNTSGGFATLLAADGQHMLTLYSLNLGLVISMVTNLIAGCILAIATEWKLGLIAVFGCLPIMLAAGFMRSHLDQTAQDRNAAAFLECARYSTEIIAAIRTV
jgi:ATP-binding cassette subfamily B (MDR/TAP) protein 1